jgi:GTP cyclohydrolase I
MECNADFRYVPDSLRDIVRGTATQPSRQSERPPMYKPEDLELVRKLLSLVGEDPDREGLQETPLRFLKAIAEYTKGYRENPEDVLKVFEDGAQSADEMVIVRDIPVYSLCEHHLAPFFGKAHIGYVPDQRILGLSKLSRLVEVYARRLQVQERLTNQIADALATHLQPLGVAVVIECRHMCMESRGVRHTGASTVTSALRGSVKNNPDTRREFLSLIRDRA